MKKLSMVRVTWKDAHSVSGWTDFEEANEIIDQYPGGVEMETLGFLIRKDKTTVVVAGSVSKNQETYGELFIIPLPMVKKLDYLKE